MDDDTEMMLDRVGSSEGVAIREKGIGCDGPELIVFYDSGFADCDVDLLDLLGWVKANHPEWIEAASTPVPGSG